MIITDGRFHNANASDNLETTGKARGLFIPELADCSTHVYRFQYNDYTPIRLEFDKITTT
jgi:hypothetical protein